MDRAASISIHRSLPLPLLPCVSTPPQREQSPIAKPAPKSFLGRLRGIFLLLLLLLVLAVALLFIPAVFQRALRRLIALEAWRHDVTVTIGQVEGSLYEPLVLRKSRWTFESRAGSVTRIEVTRAEAEFSWPELLPGRGAHWFRRLTLDGVTGKVDIPLPGTGVAHPPKEGEPHSTWYPAPARMEANDVDLLFQSEDDYLRLQGSRLLISELEPGFLDIAQLSVKQPWLTRTFRNVHATTALREGEVKLADLQLDPTVLVKNFSADVREIARGILDMSMEVDAFGAKRIIVQAQAVPGARGTELDATVRFSDISIAPLVDFLGISEASGGTIKNGDLNFRGSPRDLAHASMTLRLEATNFQWESRQWDSLVLGATLLGGRAQIPALELRQGHNHLTLNGEMALPSARRPWWQSDFNFNIEAHIDNLTELSALLLPDFKYAAGKVSIDGSVRCKDQQYFGLILATGSGLAWRSAPIQELNAAIRLAGKEIQVAKFDLDNKDDFLRAQGVYSLDGTGNYKGDVHARVQDLAAYAAILQKPLVPEALAGGASVRWMGEGSPKGQSGRFSAHLEKLRPLSPAASQLHPVNADLEGSYAPAQLSFSRLDVADEECALHAQVAIAARSLQLKELKLTHGAQTWLEGEALLPLDVWQTWPEIKLASLLAEETPGRLKLKITALSLQQAARLTGWNWPITGVLDGELAVEGALGHLAGQSHLNVRHGSVPLTNEHDLLGGLNGDFTLDGNKLTAAALTAQHVSGSYTGEGTLDLTRFRDPALSLHLLAPDTVIPLFRGATLPVATLTETLVPGALRGRFTLDLQVEGPLSTATLHGTAGLSALTTGGEPDFAGLWKSAALPELPAPVTMPPICAGWKLDVLCQTSAGPVGDPAQPQFLPELRLAGTGAAPLLTGKLEIKRLPVRAGPLTLTLGEASIAFRDKFPRDPTIDLHATGIIDGLPFNAYALGPLTRHIAFLDSEAAHAALLRTAPAAGAALPGKAFPAWATFSHEAPAPAPTAPKPPPHE